MPSWNERYSQFSNVAGDGVRRVFFYAGRRPSLISRILALAIVLAIVTIALLILIPFIVIAAVALAIGWFFGAVRELFMGARGPNGPLDQRRNVRVIRRSDQK